MPTARPRRLLAPRSSRATAIDVSPAPPTAALRRVAPQASGQPRAHACGTPSRREASDRAARPMKYQYRLRWAARPAPTASPQRLRAPRSSRAIATSVSPGRYSAARQRVAMQASESPRAHACSTSRDRQQRAGRQCQRRWAALLVRIARRQRRLALSSSPATPTSVSLGRLQGARQRAALVVSAPPSAPACSMQPEARRSRSQCQHQWAGLPVTPARPRRLHVPRCPRVFRLTV